MIRFGCLYFIMFFGWQYAVGSPVSITKYEYVREVDAWLRLHIVPATWSDAAVLCQLEGGVLASPTTSAMAQAMLDAMVKHKLASKTVFVGATRLFSEGDLKSLDGEVFTNTSLWLSFGEPNNTKDCLALTGAGAFAEVSCARVLPYFCRKTAQNPATNIIKISMIPISQCSEVGYEFEEETGSCYKFHRLARSWRSAMAACRAEGGHLAIINNIWESNVLANIFAKKIKSSDVIGANSGDYCLIGFRKWDDEAWGTIYGETPAKIEMFLPNIKNTENCGAIYLHGGIRISDVKCTNPYVYICEITPEDKCWQYAVSSPVSVTKYEYVREADAWLRLHIMPATWSDAAVRCQLEGGVLASPTTIAMAEAMMNAMAEQKLNSSVFVGITGVFSKGDFKSLDGKNLTDIPLEWALGEPNNADDGEDCLVLTGAGTLADFSCSRVLPYFCRKSSYNTTNYDRMLRRAETQCYRNGYNWEQQIGSCYWVQRFAKTWRHALAQCHTDGGQLAIVNSDTEAAVLRNYCVKHLDSYQWGIGAKLRDSCAIGFRKWDDGKWATVDGESLKEAGFKDWVEDKTNRNGTENCGAISRDGRLSSIPCKELYVFICEIIPYF